MLVALVIGLSIGSIYGLTAMGLVLTYRTSGVFNLAHGAVGMLGTYVFWQLRVGWGWPVPVALVVAVGVASPIIGALVHLLVFRWVRERPIAVTLVATIALLVVLQGVAGAIWGTIFKDLPSLFPFKLFALTDSFNVTSEQLGTMAVTLGIAILLLWYLQRTRFGLKTRAVVDNRDLAEVNGYNADRIQMTSWAVAAAISTLSGILISPFIQLSIIGLTLVVIQAMAAAVVGRLQSLPLTYLGGLGLGILESMLAKFLPSTQAAQGLKVSSGFLVLYGAIILGSFLGKVFGGGSSEVRAGLLGREVRPSRLTPLVVLFASLALVTPFLPSYIRFLITSALIASIAFQGFVLVSGLGGQVLLCQAAFVGIGAIMYSRMVTDWKLPLVVATVGALLVALVLGLAVSLPAVRIRGLPLALLTLAFGLFMDSFVFVAKSFSGGYAGFTVPRPTVFGLNLADDQVLRYLVFAVALLVALLVRNLASGRTGRLLVAVKNSEAAAESFGTSVRKAKLLLFGMSSVLGALSGVLAAIQIQSVAAVQFNVSQSILFLAVAVLGGVGSPQGAVIGGLLLYLVPDLLNRLGVLEYQQLLFGIGAVGVLVARRGGVSDMIFRPLVTRLSRSAPPPAVVPSGAGAGVAERRARERTAALELAEARA